MSTSKYKDGRNFKKYRVDSNPYALGFDTDGFDNKTLTIDHLSDAVWLVFLGYIASIFILIAERIGFKTQKTQKRVINRMGLKK